MCLSCNDSKNNTQTPIKIVSVFDAQEVEWFKSKGTGTISGTAKFKSKNGEVRFGKEFRIELMPSSSYTEERLQHIYHNKQSGAVYAENGILTFTPDPKGYHDTIKMMCDENGMFTYNNLPAGDYYVIAFMLWDTTGGGLMQRVTLSEGETTHIEMKNF